MPDQVTPVERDALMEVISSANVGGGGTLVPPFGLQNGERWSRFEPVITRKKRNPPNITPQLAK
jgi:hypothetical protein